MAKALILYRTKYGSTRQYAEWIAQACGADLLALEKVKPEALAAYDSIVLGSCVYVGRIQAVNFLVKNQASLEGKRVLLFSVSGTDPDSPAARDLYLSSVPEALRERIRYFHLRGRLGKIDLFDQLLMLFPKFAARSKYNKSKSEEDRLALESLDHFDYMDPASIQPILAALNAPLA